MRLSGCKAIPLPCPLCPLCLLEEAADLYLLCPQMRGVISSIQDPDTVHDSLRDYSLHLKLHRLTELSGLNMAVLPSLTIEIR